MSADNKHEIDNHRFVLKGVSRECLSSEAFSLFVERFSGAEPVQVLQSETDLSAVMLVFKDEKDYSTIQTSHSKRPELLKKMTTLHQVGYPRTVLLECKGKDMSAETIELYFESKKSGGGDGVLKSINQRGKFFVLTFSDHQVALRMLERKHKIGECELDLRLVYPELDDFETLEEQDEKEELTVHVASNSSGESLSPREPRIRRQPRRRNHAASRPLAVSSDGGRARFDQPHLVTVPLGQFAAWFIQHHSNNKQRFFAVGRRLHAFIQFTADSVTAAPGRMTRINDRTTWRNEVRQALEEEVNEYIEEDMELQSDEVSEIMQRLDINKVGSSYNFDLRNTYARICGRRDAVKEIESRLRAGARRASYSEEPGATLQQATDEVTLQSPVRAQILNSSGTLKQLADQHKVSVQVEQGSVIAVRGPRPSIDQFKNDLLMKLMLLKESSVPLSETQKVYFEEVSSRLDALTRSLSSVPGSVVVELAEDSLIITSLGPASRSVSKLVKEMTETREWTIPIPARNAVTGKLDEMKQLATVNDPMLHIEIKDSLVALMGPVRSMEMAISKLSAFVSKHTVVKNVYSLSEGKRLFMELYCKDELSKLQSEFHQYQVQVHLTENGVEVSSTMPGMYRVMKVLKFLDDQMVSHEHDVDQPGINRQYLLNEGKHLLNSVGLIYKCAIRVVETSGQRRPFGARTGAGKGSASKRRFKHSSGTTLVVANVDLTSLQVDMVVNAANGELQHVGGLAAALAKKGGPSIQTECNSHVKTNGNLSPGQVFVSKAGNLPCKVLAHAVGPSWHASKDANLIRLATDKCLCEAKDRRLTSVAIPAISSGVFGYPPQLSCDTVVDGVMRFLTKHGGVLKEIWLVDSDATKTDLFAKAIEKHNTPEVSGINSASLIATPTLSKSSDKVSPMHIGPSGTKATIGNVVLKIVQGDITQEQTDAIVNSTGADFHIVKGGVSDAICRAGGPGLTLAIQNIGQIRGHVTVTDGGNLRCKVIHAVANSRAGIRKVVEEILALADLKGLSSLSLPALGTGNMGGQVDQVARDMVDAVVESAKKMKNVQLIRFVIFQSQMVTAFTRALQDANGTVQKKSMGMDLLKPAKKTVGVDVEESFVERVVLELTMSLKIPESSCFNRVTEALDAEFQGMIDSKEISHEQLHQLDESSLEKLRDVCKKMNVEMRCEINEHVSRIIVRAQKSALLNVVTTINTMIHQLVQEHQELLEAGVVAASVQWIAKRSGHSEEIQFSAKINLKLEKAYIQGKPTVFQDENGDTWSADTVAKTAICMHVASAGTKAKHFTLQRNEIDKVAPSEWDPMSPQETVKLVPLNSSSQEFKDVQQRFNRTAPNQVSKVERIQSKYLYKQYAVHKERMSKTHRGPGALERRLYHGTDLASVGAIYETGFNRNFSGRHAVAYGQGVYFAHNAQYSLGYARGSNRMFEALVLVGEYTVGNAAMRHPPAKPGSGSDTYDCTVNDVNNPSIFVTYHDAQMYPAYLIHFA